MNPKNVLADFKRNIIIEDIEKSNALQENDAVYFFSENLAEVPVAKAFLELTGEYSTLQSWTAMKNSLEYSPELYAESDVIKIIKYANANFPNQDADITFTILSVVYICVNQLLKDPYGLLVHDNSFLEFFLKLPNCFTSDFAKRSILSAADIVQVLVNTYNPKLGANESILIAFHKIQERIIGLISSNFFSEMAVSLLIPLLDDMIIITNEEDAPVLLNFFSCCIDITKSMNISKFSIKSCLHLFTKFPNVYNLIIQEPFNFLKELVSFLDPECGCIQYVTEIIKPLLTNEKGCNLLLELGYGPALLKVFTYLIALPNSNYGSYYLLEDISIICETSQNGCSFFISSSLLENQELITKDQPFKIMVYFLRIIYAALTFGILPPSKIAVQLAINAVGVCLESEELDILFKSLKIVRFLHEQGIDIISNVKEQLELLSLGEFNEEISNESIALMKLIETE